MKAVEKQEIAKLPEKYRPMGAWKYFWYSVLFALPIIGFISLLVCAFSGSNICRRSYARSFFCGFLIIGLVVVVSYLIAFFAFGMNFAMIMEYFKGLVGGVA